MKLFKQLILIAISAFMAVNTVNANTPSNTQKGKQSVQKEDPNLKLFNQSFSIKLIHRSIVTINNQEQLLTKYEIENKSKNTIKAAHWISALHDGKQVIFTQDIPISFDKGLEPKSKLVIDVAIPLANIPEPARSIFLDPKTPIGSLSGAKSLTFSNGKKIVIK